MTTRMRATIFGALFITGLLVASSDGGMFPYLNLAGMVVAGVGAVFIPSLEELERGDE